MKRLIPLITILSGFIVTGENIVKNGSFEGLPGKRPSGWNWGCARNAKCKFEIVSNNAADGSTAVQIINLTPKTPNVFGAMTQYVKLAPGVEYSLSIKVKGNGGGLSIRRGRLWRGVISIKPSAAWRTYTRNFKIDSKELEPNGLTVLKIISEDKGKVWIDDLKIKPSGDGSVIGDERPLYKVNKLSGNFEHIRSIPSRFKKMHLPKNTGQGSINKKDFSADLAFGYDKQGLIFLANISDDKTRNVPGSGMWVGDSIQVRFDCSAKRSKQAEATDLELGFNVAANGKVGNWCWSGPGKYSGHSLSNDVLETRAVKTKAGYFLVARISWKLLHGMNKPANGRFGFNVAINESDKSGERKVYFLTPGIHDYKGSDKYYKGMIDFNTPSEWVSIDQESNHKALKGSMAAINQNGKLAFTAELIDSKGKKINQKIAGIEAQKNEVLEIPFKIALTKLSQGCYTVEFKLNGKTIKLYKGCKEDLYKKQVAIFDNFMKKLASLNKEFTAFYGKNECSAYISIPLFILKKHLPEFRNRLLGAKTEGEKKYYAEKAAMINPELIEEFKDLEQKLVLLKSGKTLPATFKFVSSPVSLVNGWPQATVKDMHGNKQVRPVVFDGFGHFGYVDRNIENFQYMGVNAVQVEIGPRSFFPRESKKQEFEPDFKKFDKRFNPLLKKAWENNIQIVLLISPHYIPKWLVKKYPDLKQTSGTFGYEFNHPVAIRMMKAYIPALMGRLKINPYFKAIHSICLSNEPSYAGCSLENKFSVKQFKQYMEKKYGNISAFNRKAQRNFKDFDSLINTGIKDSAVKYEFYTFSHQAFSGFHRLLATEIKKVCPEMPVHAKVMAWRSFLEYDSGTDPEQMAELSDYNGNDSSSTYGQGSLAAGTSFFQWHETQISSKPISVCNSENHIIDDNEDRPIPNDHVYTALMEQHISGASTIITWVYSPYWYERWVKNNKYPFAGSIYHRPGNLIAHAKAQLDAMRLAPQLKKFLVYKPEIAMIYSSTSVALGNYGAQPYSQLSSTGYRPRFVTEKQLAQGNMEKTKLIFATGVPEISNQAAEGMGKFVRNGGVVIVDNFSLRKNEFGNKLNLSFKPVRINDFSIKNLKKYISKTIRKLPVSMQVIDGKSADNIVFRMVPDEKNNWIINLVNYNSTSRNIKLTGQGSFYDLISEKEFKPELELRPLKPFILRFTPNKQ